MSMGKTIAEKIFSLRSGLDARAGDVIMARVDAAMSNDASGPLTIEIFHKMEAKQVPCPERIAFILDHYVPCPDSKVAKLQQSVFDFAAAYNIPVCAGGEGIAHQVFDEKGYVQPGRLIVGGDSHTTTYGYLNCLGIGIGSSDMAMVFQSGELWFKVPETVRIDFTGMPAPGISGKEVALYLVRMLGADGGNYRAVEYGGEGLAHLTMNDRRTICNMMAECCAKCSVMPFDETAAAYCRERGLPAEGAVAADADCRYCERYTVDLSQVEHLIACPHSVDGSVPISRLAGQKVDMVLLGTCTNGRLEDFRAVYGLLKQVPGRFRAETLVVPASRSVYLAMIEEGIASELMERGAMFLTPSCGPCCGSSPGVPRDGFTVLSTANRNFLGRMGNTTANIYLGSPLAAAAAALTGRFTDPKELMGSDPA